MKTESIIRLFWSNVDKNGTTPTSQTFRECPLGPWDYDEEKDIHVWTGGPCWLWKGAINLAGYGIFTRGRIANSQLAHRIAFKLVYGVEAPGELIHGCDTPACMNPYHVVPATHAANMEDRAIKGRANHSEETKRKIGAANTISLRGQTQSEETKRKRANSLRRAHAEGRHSKSRPDVSTEQICVFYSLMKSMPRVSRLLGVSIPTVHRRLQLVSAPIQPLGTNQTR